MDYADEMTNHSLWLQLSSDQTVRPR